MRDKTNTHQEIARNLPKVAVVAPLVPLESNDSSGRLKRAESVIIEGIEVRPDNSDQTRPPEE